MEALVTGDSGTVGSAVTRRLEREGWQVRAPDRAALGDARALRAIARGVGLAVHCAASRSNDLAECRRVNVEGTARLVDALVEGGCRLLVHISTLSVYDDGAGPRFDEDSALQATPGDAYGFTKAEAERVVLGAAPRGLDAVILRPGLVLSMHPRSRWGPLALERARAAPGSILPFPLVPYVDVENLAGAVLLAATIPAARGRAYNVIDGVGDGAEYLAAVYGAIGLPPPPIPLDAPRLSYSGERARQELGYAPVGRWREFLVQLAATFPARQA